MTYLPTRVGNLAAGLANCRRRGVSTMVVVRWVRHFQEVKARKEKLTVQTNNFPHDEHLRRGV